MRFQTTWSKNGAFPHSCDYFGITPMHRLITSCVLVGIGFTRDHKSPYFRNLYAEQFAFRFAPCCIGQCFSMYVRNLKIACDLS